MANIKLLELYMLYDDVKSAKGAITQWMNKTMRNLKKTRHVDTIFEFCHQIKQQFASIGFKKGLAIATYIQAKR